MLRTRIDIDLTHFPECFHPFLKHCPVYDSSCSPEANVWFLEKDGGLYLKRAAKGTLKTDASMTQFFHGKGLAAQVVAYAQLEQDWLLTSRVPGEDCVFQQYLDDPKRLSALLGQLLRQLHETDIDGCPVPDRTKSYLQTVSENYHNRRFDDSLFPDNWGYASAEDAWRVVQEMGPYLKSDTLLHGDYCLPNVMLDNWKFSGFIDLGGGGVGDRHIDLFWGLWSLNFNLKTNAWSDRFLDAYGRDRIDSEILNAIGAFEVFG